jgi:DNA-binding Xre family transcriptional regulator
VTKRLQALRKKIQADPQRRERVQKYERAIETTLALARLREARAVKQSELAARMAVSQSNVSRIEHEDDLYLSTLRSYVESLGGRLELTAVFPDAVIAIGAADIATPVSQVQDEGVGHGGTDPVEHVNGPMAQLALRQGTHPE